MAKMARLKKYTQARFITTNVVLPNGLHKSSITQAKLNSCSALKKGTLDINDPAVNDYFPPEQMRVPFRNIVYIGDSDTDIPCMKLVNSSGGHSIGVYNPSTMDKQKVFKMIQDNRIKHFAPADYSEGSELDQLVKAIIDKTATYEKLESNYFDNLAEARGK